MIGQGKTIGLILMLVAVVLALAIGLYLFSGIVEGRLTGMRLSSTIRQPSRKSC